MDRIGVASLQYFIRPVQRFEQSQDQVEGLLGTAADYGCQLVVFPEYFTLQLLTLGDVKRPIPDQIRDLSGYLPRFMDIFERAARQYRFYVCAGSIPVLIAEWRQEYNRHRPHSSLGYRPPAPEALQVAVGLT